jgi:hypothetical protein
MLSPELNRTPGSPASHCGTMPAVLSEPDPPEELDASVLVSPWLELLLEPSASVVEPRVVEPVVSDALVLVPPPSPSPRLEQPPVTIAAKTIHRFELAFMDICVVPCGSHRTARDELASARILPAPEHSAASRAQLPPSSHPPPRGPPRRQAALIGVLGRRSPKQPRTVANGEHPKGGRGPSCCVARPIELAKVGILQHALGGQQAFAT